VCIGKETQIRPFSLLDARNGRIAIGSYCSLNDYCVIYGMGDVIVGDNVRIATHTVIVSGNHNFENINIPIRLQGVKVAPIIIEDDVWIGAHVCILSGVRIGTGSVIGAGAIVTKSIPAMSIAVGNPARVVSTRLRGESRYGIL
jgi:acetyltransferase-like isoleucine patch superfamily enzyme